MRFYRQVFFAMSLICAVVECVTVFFCAQSKTGGCATGWISAGVKVACLGKRAGNYLQAGLTPHPCPDTVKEHLGCQHHQNQPHQALQRVDAFLTEQAQK